MPKTRQQIAALPLRWKGSDVQVLMITSRDTGRWIVPKGWTMKNVDPWDAAAIEALEEAGAKGRIAKQEFGTYDYIKRMDDGSEVKCKVRVFPMIVERLKDDWKEKDERDRKWFSLEKAAELISEDDLGDLLLALAQKPKRAPVVGPMLRKAAS